MLLPSVLSCALHTFSIYRGMSETWEKHTSLRLWRSERHLQPPDFPADLLFCPSTPKPAQSTTLFPPLLEELHSKLASHTSLR